MHTLIFTHYDEGSNINFITFVKSIASNLPAGDLFELIVIAEKNIPRKIIQAISPYFLAVTQTKPTARVNELNKDCVTDVIIQYTEHDRWYISSNLIVTSALEKNPNSNVFYRTDTSTISTKALFIKAGSVIPQIVKRLVEKRYVETSRYNITSEDLSFILTNNFLAHKIIPQKVILTEDNLTDYARIGKDPFNFFAMDLTNCEGSEYSQLSKTLVEIFNKQKDFLVKVDKSKNITPINSYTSRDHIDYGKIDRDPNKVSVIMTNFNCSKFLDRAIKSVLNQTHTNLELIIVDDSSTDNSLEIIKKYASLDSRIRVFQNLEQRGTYWAKNSVLSKVSGSYVTMIDSDDYDTPNRLEKQLAQFITPDIVCVTCLNDRRSSDFPNVSEKVSIGYPSMMFRYRVFEELGYYDTVKFGADSEFYDRVILHYGYPKIRKVNEVLQISPRRTDGLTSIIPEKSSLRQTYFNNYRRWHTLSNSRYIEFPQKTRKFQIPKESRVEYSDLSNSKIVSSKSTQILPVIMCTWKRVDGFNNVVKQLNSQTFKNFKLFVWNNNPSLENDFKRALSYAKFDYELYTSPKNIGGFGRFYYAKQIRRNPGLMDYCVFIDDDQTFDSNLLATFISEAKSNTILSQWGWEFTQLNYYGEESRRQRLPGETLHYAGTGGMIADMRVFESEGLFDCPTQYWFVEDLWLSFYANHILGFNLVKSSAVMKNGDDQHSLYKIVKDLKTPMLIDLVEKYKWHILDELYLMNQSIELDDRLNRSKLVKLLSKIIKF